MSVSKGTRHETLIHLRFIWLCLNIFGSQLYLLGNTSRGSSACDTLIISGMKTDESEAEIPGKKEKRRCNSVKFSGVKNGDRQYMAVGKEKRELLLTLVHTNQ